MTTSQPSGWLEGTYSALATEAILDAAGQLFAEKGVASVGMVEVARAAGCSRQTLYRYFASKQELRLAFVQREARRVGAAVALDVAECGDASERVVEGTMCALRRVRDDVVLHAWFTGAANSSIALAAAQASPVVDELVTGVLGAGARGAWLIRVIVSFLAMPGATEQEERELVKAFVLPVVLPAGGATG